jgi:hypothetical protein
VGGPIGAVIGGGVGLFKAWDDAVSQSRQNLRDSIKINEDYADSFDRITGAITKQTRQTAFGNLQNTGAIDVARAIGIPDREVVLAATGNVEALERIKARVDKLTGTRRQLEGPNSDLFYFNKENAASFIQSLKFGSRELSEEQREFIKSLEAAKSYGEALKGIP